MKFCSSNSISFESRSLATPPKISSDLRRPAPTAANQQQSRTYRGSPAYPTRASLGSITSYPTIMKYHGTKQKKHKKSKYEHNFKTVSAWGSNVISYSLVTFPSLSALFTGKTIHTFHHPSESSSQLQRFRLPSLYQLSHDSLYPGMSVQMQ